MLNNVKINNVENMNNTEYNNSTVYNGTVNETNIDKVNTMNNIEYNSPVIDDDTNELTLNDYMKQPFEIKIEKEEVGNIFAIAYKGTKAAYATNIKDIKNDIYEGKSAYDASLKVLYRMLQCIKETSKYKKQMNTIMLWGDLNNLADNKNTFNGQELKAIANEILKMKQELKDCVTFKKVERGGKVYGDEYKVKNAAWTLLK